jgi:hypothetical protein
VNCEVKIGSVWRENDTRFERYVQVVGFCEVTTRYTQPPTRHPGVEIAACSPDGSGPNGRTTKARISRFGTAYKLIKEPV